MCVIELTILVMTFTVRVVSNAILYTNIFYTHTNPNTSTLSENIIETKQDSICNSRIKRNKDM